jgi:diguanylate cyclase (GGDEF)-like protein
VTTGDGLPPPVERCYQRADGSTFWGEVNGRPLRPAHPATARTTRGVVLAIEDVTRRREDQARIKHLAHHDHLTGLPNRPYFIERAQQAVDLARRQGRKVGLLFIDLDRFKQVNDRFGHDAGDCVLKTVANRMRMAIRTSDTVCRQGGDEYVVLLPDLESVQGLQTLAHKLLAAIEEPIAYDQQALSVSASIGMAYFPDHATTIEALVAAADAAMYQSKGDETQRISLYEPG